MSKQDNLKDFLTDVADAIREKKSTTDLINPQDFSEEIRGIESGGMPTAEWNDVNFYDYEGTILYSYTWDEFVAKNEMPPLPTHREKEGLVCQEWNYTLEEVLEQGGRCDVGAIYDTVDGHTHIKVQQYGNVEYTICMQTSVVNGGEIHWGDGTVTTSISTTLEYYSHIYPNAGKYDIRVILKEGTISNFGVKKNQSGTYQDIQEVNIGHTTTSICNDAFRYTLLTRISIPEHLYVGERCFSTQYYGNRRLAIQHLNIPRVVRGAASQLCEGMSGLRSISIANTSNNYNQYMFSALDEIRHLHIPSNTTLSFLAPCFSLQNITSSPLNSSVTTEGNVCVIKGRLYTGGNSAKIPKGVTQIYTYAFAYKGQLREVDIPDSVTSIGNAAFNFCSGLTHITLPPNITLLEADTFGRLTSMTAPIRIPPAVRTIQNYCFTGTTNTSCFDFSRHEFVPTLNNASAFSNNGGWKIVVPDALYDEWIVATNWVSYASRIVKASEFVEPTQE